MQGASTAEWRRRQNKTEQMCYFVLLKATGGGSLCLMLSQMCRELTVDDRGGGRCQSRADRLPCAAEGDRRRWRHRNLRLSRHRDCSPEFCSCWQARSSSFLRKLMLTCMCIGCRGNDQSCQKPSMLQGKASFTRTRGHTCSRHHVIMHTLG
jgi:hypothetical protein